MVQTIWRQSLATLIATAQPHAVQSMHLSPSAVAELVPAAETSNAELTTNLTDTITKIAKEGGEMLDNVPYVKAISGVVLQIIKIRTVRPSNSIAQN